MFAGHMGVGLALGRAERRVNVGVFIAAGLLLDLLLWLFVLLGWETVTLPADFARTHQPEFIFPYSHGLLAAVGWSALAGAAAFAAYGRLGAARMRIASLVAAAVFSHWLLDALVHRPEMPLASPGSATVGGGLWQNMPIAMAVEAAIVVVGLGLFLRGCRLSRRKRAALAMLSLIVLAFTVVGMTMAPPPPSAQAMAASSLAVLVLVCALAGWLARPLGGPWPTTRR
ncbi:hypothetical protein VAR608DRAFT_0684 [Variovorax sp. HW608]|nr:hypothetical protein VAR608DRAFT_0684 [Variovorax sp. HW608]